MSKKRHSQRPIPSLIIDTVSGSYAEAYRSLRTNVAFAELGSRVRTIVITSPNPRDGKTTVSSNLAIACAQSGKRVVLIDADLRRPLQHRIFQVSNELGLVYSLSSDSGLNGNLVQTQVPNLTLLTSGPVPANPTELLGSETMRSTLAKLKEHFDIIILDSPPILADADTSVLVRMVDGVLLVLHAGKTPRAAAELAVKQLRKASANILGVILNNIDFDREGYYYQYYYSYYDKEYASDKPVWAE